MPMTEDVRLVALQNDALALALANFDLPIIDWQVTSERTGKELKATTSRGDWLISGSARNTLGTVKPKHASTSNIIIRMGQVPKGFSPKVKYIKTLMEIEGEYYVLTWRSVTIHPHQSTEENYQALIIREIEEAWLACEGSALKKLEKNLVEFRPSILVLEEMVSEHGKGGFESDEEFLWRKVMPKLYLHNSVSRKMFTLVKRKETRRGVVEYEPFKHA
jgi:hypothetical protein